MQLGKFGLVSGCALFRHGVVLSGGIKRISHASGLLLSLTNIAGLLEPLGDGHEIVLSCSLTGLKLKLARLLNVQSVDNLRSLGLKSPPSTVVIQVHVSRGLSTLVAGRRELVSFGLPCQLDLC